MEFHTEYIQTKTERNIYKHTNIGKLKMSETVKAINEFFRYALKTEVANLKEELNLTERQENIFERFYIKKQDINFIADTLFISAPAVNKELKHIRKKIIRIIDKL